MAHEERAHARLSASGSKRWLNCTPSVVLEEQFEDTSSNHAAEGTLAHELAELSLKLALGWIEPVHFVTEANSLMESVYYKPAMAEYIQRYVDFVIERVYEARSRCADPVILLEQRLDFSDWVPAGYGTGDVVIIADGLVEIIDLKYGTGVKVEADDNSQLMLYALGAISGFGTLYEFDTVRLTIHQPRLDAVSSADYMVDDLLYWGDSYVAPRAELAAVGEGEFKPGEHCMFCKAKSTCRARAKDALEAAKLEFKEPPMLLDAEIAAILLKTDHIKKWATDVEKYALKQALEKGTKYAGFKLVEGRSNRVFVDEAFVAAALLADGYSEESIYQPRELHGITAIESMLGKKRFSDVLGDYVMKPPGKPTLVPASDKRAELKVSTAQEDFA